MRFPSCFRRPRVAALCLLALALATPRARADDFVAPFVPTVMEDVRLMLEIAGVGPEDYVIDLGSGDGRIVIEAARRGAAGHGMELDPELVTLASANAREAGVADRVAFQQGDIFEADIAPATVVALYLFPEANIELRPKLLSELRPGTRVVSNSFHMEDWQPVVHDMSARSSGGILLWIIPARIAGDWTIEIDGEARTSLAIEQQYQDIKLELTDSAAALAIDAATLEGDRIRFSAASADARYLFDGNIDEDLIQGFVQIERGDAKRIARWRARRQTSPAVL